MNAPKKIGVLRANALGDFILTLPALHSLKKTYPDSEIVLLGRKSHVEFMKGKRGPIDRIIPIPAFIRFDESLLTESREKQDFVESLKKEKFDLIIQLHGGGRYTNHFVQQISPQWSVGARTKDAPMLHENVPYTQFQHEVLRQLEIIERAGARPSIIYPEIIPEEEETIQAKRSLSGLTDSDGPFILINPGATDIRRRWPARKFADVSDYLIERGYIILINVGPGEIETGKEVLNFIRYKNSAYMMTPSLGDLTGIISASTLVISNDTGTMHVAMAMSRPVVALFWYGNLLNYGPMASRTTSVLISKQTMCPDCHAVYFDRICEHTHSWISEITVSSVLESSLELLKQNLIQGVQNEQDQGRSLSW